jgi:hypothetical protein
MKGDRWLVTLGGAARDYPPTDEAGFLAFARSFPTPLFVEALDAAEPLSPIYGYRKMENQWRHFEKVRNWPENLLVLGDAVCSFNPLLRAGHDCECICRLDPAPSTQCSVQASSGRRSNRPQ